MRHAPAAGACRQALQAAGLVVHACTASTTAGACRRPLHCFTRPPAACCCMRPAAQTHTLQPPPAAVPCAIGGPSLPPSVHFRRACRYGSSMHCTCPRCCCCPASGRSCCVLSQAGGGRTPTRALHSCRPAPVLAAGATCRKPGWAMLACTYSPTSCSSVPNPCHALVPLQG